MKKQLLFLGGLTLCLTNCAEDDDLQKTIISPQEKVVQTKTSLNQLGYSSIGEMLNNGWEKIEVDVANLPNSIVESKDRTARQVSRKRLATKGDLSKMGINNADIEYETRKWDQWLAHYAWYYPDGVAINQEVIYGSNAYYSPTIADKLNTKAYISTKEAKFIPSLDPIYDEREVYEFEVFNYSNQTDSSSQTFTYQVGESTSISYTEGLSIAATGGVSIPLLAEAKVTVTGSFSASQNYTNSTLKTVSQTYNAEMPPKTKRKIILVVSTTDIEGTFSLPYELSGDYAAHFGHVVHGHYFHVYDAQNLMKYAENPIGKGYVKYISKQRVQAYASPAESINSSFDF